MKTPHTVLLREYFEQESEEGTVIAFKEAGDELVEFVVRGNKYSWYEVFLRPIGFLYRHYLELEIKYWIKELSNEKPLAQKGKLLKEHNLKKLWLELKPLIHSLCVTEDKDFIEVEEVILTFDKYDQTGQEFRYTRTTKDTSTLRSLPPIINVKEVKRSIERVSFFFDGLSGVVEV
jgi:hypothetical protein